MGVILAIESSWDNDYRCILFECDSLLVCQVFSSPQIFRWSLRGRWRKSMKGSDTMDWKVIYIFCEGYYCLDKLSNFGMDNILDF